MLTDEARKKMSDKKKAYWAKFREIRRSATPVEVDINVLKQLIELVNANHLDELSVAGITVKKSKHVDKQSERSEQISTADRILTEDDNPDFFQGLNEGDLYDEYDIRSSESYVNKRSAN